MRPRDPRRLLERRDRARVRITDVSRSEYAADGSVGSRQEAEVTLPRAELDRVWSPEYLERLARTYWHFLSRISLGILRVLYGEDSRDVVALTRPFVLLRFHKPEYHTEADRGTVTWPIADGLLVAPSGRNGNGYLRLSVQRREDEDPELITAVVSSEVKNFYPLIAGWGWFSRVGQVLYNQTQLRIHLIVTRAFLRSLAKLELERSVVGSLAGPAGTSPDALPLSPSASPGRAER